MTRTTTLSIIASIWSLSAFAQYASTSLDENNSAAEITDIGYLFSHLGTSTAGYEIPAGSGKNSLFSASMWFGGQDINGQYKLAAQQYFPARDFQPGVLSIGAAIPAPTAMSQTIWTVSKDEILNHILNYQNSGYVIPNDILEWPAHGDVSNSQAYNLAPFVDVDNDDIYNPQNGDYPCIKGDKAVYTIINDKYFPHSSQGDLIGLEIHYMLYQFSSVTELNDVTFIDAKVINRSTNTLFDYSTSFFADGDLGGATDDFAGCDSTRNLMFTYNGDSYDESSNGNLGYDSLPPAIGVVCLSHEVNSIGYYSNGSAASPNTAVDYYHLMKGKAINGSDLLDNNGQTTTFMFPGDPNDLSQWSEVNSLGFPSSIPGDRRMLMSIEKPQLDPFEEYVMTFAVVYGQGTDNLQSVEELYQVTDDVQEYYDNVMTTDCFASNVGIDDLSLTSSLVYPNPSNGSFVVDFGESLEDVTLTMIDMSGRVVLAEANLSGHVTAVVTNVNPGVYLLRVTSGRGGFTQRIIIE